MVNISINIQDNTWKIVLYGGVIVAFVVQMLPSYLSSTELNKNDILLMAILYFLVFFLLFFLTVEIIDIHRKLRVLLDSKEH
ncbi:hypothetical protein [Methanocalculus sp.]|uniref:hypothetical protein n=1 Tax=Methanocalculus sp. TaxID=2004547 RepID=UPI00260A715B|nr:hypothetical protein [Methanocalculus sp.]MDG6250624.1 hypothetical protein [Methanocalculus sp.]